MSGTDPGGSAVNTSTTTGAPSGMLSTNTSDSLSNAAAESSTTQSPSRTYNEAAPSSTRTAASESGNGAAPAKEAAGAMDDDEVMQDGFNADTTAPTQNPVTEDAKATDGSQTAPTSDTPDSQRLTNGATKMQGSLVAAAPQGNASDEAQPPKGEEVAAAEPKSAEECGDTHMNVEPETRAASDEAKEGARSTSASESATPLASPPLRHASPALSVASETPSQSAAPVASTSAVAYSGQPAVVELALPFIEYPLANITLVPAGSSAGHIPFYTTWPPEPLEMSWMRSRRGDDPEQDLAPSTECGYFATPEEVEASRQKEELRQAKIRARIEEYEQERSASLSAFGSGSRGRGGSKQRGRGRVARVRARGRADSASREGSLDPSYEETPAAPAARRGGRPPKPALRAVQPEANGAKMAVEQVEQVAQVEPKPPKPRITDATMARLLLPIDLQTTLPASIKPHPAEIDPLDLPPFYIAPTEVPAARPPVLPERPPAARSPAAATPVEAGATAAAAEPSPAAAPTSSGAAAPRAAEAKALAVAESLKSPAKSKSPKHPRSSEDAEPDVAATGGIAEHVLAEVGPQRPAAGSTTHSADFHGDGKDAGSSKRPRSPQDEGRRASKKPALEDESRAVVKSGANAGQAAPVELAPDGSPIEYAVQSTTCLAKKMEGQVRCWQCIARGIGHGCSFAGVRWFGYDRKGRIVTPPVFRSITNEEDDEPDWDKAFTMPMSDVHSNLLKTWVADALLEVFKTELKYAKAKNAVRMRHDLALQTVCDTCAESCVMSEFMCNVCGRTACPVCYLRLVEIDKQAKDSGHHATMSTADVQRRRKCIAKKRGREATSAASHTASQFVALTKYDSDNIDKLRARVQSWWDKHELAPMDAKVQDYLRKKFVIPSNLKDYDEHTRPVWTFQHRVLDDALFFEVWRNHEPIILRRCPPLDLAKFTPQYFAEKYTATRVDLIHNRTLEPKAATLGWFFSKFQTGHERRGGSSNLAEKETYRPKEGFPSKHQWETSFKELHAAFLSWLPLPNVFHPNGVLNILAHAPENAAPPDLTPELFTSWETDAATATVPLQSKSRFFPHDYDLLSHMVWGASDHRTGKLLRIRWDVFRQEDAPKLRDFCYEVLLASQPRGTSATRLRQTRDDPLLSPSIYLTKKQRALLYERTGIKPYPLYQYMGDTVLIPAGCPYQVSSWIDHINLSIPFLAGSSCLRALKVHNEARLETKERTLWREDKVQLEAMLLYTYIACEEFDHFGHGARKLRGKFNWPFPRDEKNRPIVPPEELARLQELTDAEARGTEISNEVKKAGTKAYDQAWNAGVAEAECKKRAEIAKDAKAAELRLKRERELAKRATAPSQSSAPEAATTTKPAWLTKTAGRGAPYMSHAMKVTRYPQREPDTTASPTAASSGATPAAGEAVAVDGTADAAPLKANGSAPASTGS
ncbi:hypothetical protein JCM3774_004133 [Rhodotorula dairenensis]